VQKQCNYIDIHIGGLVERVRGVRDISLGDLAANAEMAVPALQSCEAGLARFSARELMHVARYLRVDVSFFFDDLPRSRKMLSPLRKPPPTAASLTAEGGSGIGVALE
jgi:hypothetical protein